MSDPTRGLVLGPCVIGIDLSINHAAFVRLDDVGGLDAIAIVTDSSTIAKVAKAPTQPLPIRGMVLDIDARGAERLERWDVILSALLPILVEDPPNTVIAFEDYAFGAAKGAHQIGEVGGLLRLALWQAGVKCRSYAPQQSKLFAAHAGDAKKDEMIKACAARWVDFTPLTPPKTKNTVTSEDAADAMAIAQLLRTELLLRQGRIALKDLHEAEIRVFNSVGKKTKTNILDTDFVQRVK